MARELEWVTTLERFDEIAPDWDALAAAERTPFVRHAWLRTWWQHRGRGPLRIAVLWDDGRISAALPLHQSGSALQSLAGMTAFDFRLLGGEEPVRACLDLAGSACGELILHGLPASSAGVAVLRTLPRRLVRVEHLQNEPVIPTTGTFDEYLATLSSSFRKAARRRRHKLEREHAVVADVWRRPVDLSAELEEFLELEQRGWKGADGGAVLTMPGGLADYYRAFAGALHELGILLLPRIEVDGKLAAAGIAIDDGNSFWSLRSAYDEELRELGLGIDLHLRCIESCFERGYDAFELLGDDAPYKRQFAPVFREQVSVYVYDLRPRPLFHFAVRRARRAVVAGLRARLASK